MGEIMRAERQAQETRTERHAQEMLPFKKVVLLIVLIIILTILSLLFFFNLYVSGRDISKLEKALPQPTYIYDRNGEVASKISASKIEPVKIEQIPEHFILAVVAIEDRRFYEHSGADYIGIFRALFRNAKSGEIVEGGSTITQQLVKNVLLTNEKTLKRKWEELILAKKVEREYSKKEIMEMYLNQIYFGEGAWGVQKAAKIYFGKDVSELTLSESALLAGLIKAPSKLSPFKNFDDAIARRNVVLQSMLEQGFISKKELQNAKKQEIILHGKQLDEYKGKYPYYVDHIIEEAIKKYGLTQNEILSGGFHIYTELDPTMQKAVENVFRNDQLFPQSPDDQLVQSGAVIIDAKTGGIHAMVGGRGKHTFRGFNRATQLIRQPGSTMKPLAVYTPALEQGYGMFDLLKDAPVDFNGYRPTNYDGGYRGAVTMYEALIKSYNVPAVWLLNEIGIDRGVNAVERFGIPLTEKDRSLKLALGGLEEGVSPLQMAEAFSAFPNDGVRVEAHAITKIVDSNGKVIAEHQKKSIRVTEPEIAQTMTYMLRHVVTNGTGKNAQLSRHELAGKTGSTQLPIQGMDGVKDQWFVGFTPDVVGALWLGFDKTDEKHYLKTSSGETAAVIYREMMEQALQKLPSSQFKLPLAKTKMNSFQPYNFYDELEDEVEDEKIEEQIPSHGRGKEWKKEWKERHNEKHNEKHKEKHRGKKKKHDEDDDDD
jgi:penicillin-binding protein 2A